MDAGNLCLCTDSAVLCDLYRNIPFRILRRPRIKPNGIGLSFFQINTVVRLIPEALSGILRREPQIPRIHAADWAARHIFHAALTTFFGRIPAIAPCRLSIIISHVPVTVHKGKRPVFNHLCVQTAVRRVVDILKKQTDHAVLNRRLFAV